MENWKKGDIAICVNDGLLPTSNPNRNQPPLRKNMEYIIHGVYTCECGSTRLDVGISNKNGTFCRCGALSSPKIGIWWCSSERFVKKQTKSEENNNEEELEIAIQEAIEMEDYERAVELTKQLK